MVDLESVGLKPTEEKIVVQWSIKVWWRADYY